MDRSRFPSASAGSTSRAGSASSTPDLSPRHTRAVAVWNTPAIGWTATGFPWRGIIARFASGRHQGAPGERVKRVVTEAASAGTSEFRGRTGFDTQS
jgi:hypothetical protein